LKPIHGFQTGDFVEVEIPKGKNQMAKDLYVYCQGTPQEILDCQAHIDGTLLAVFIAGFLLPLIIFGVLVLAAKL
jgi:uncharacterized protein YacL